MNYHVLFSSKDKSKKELPECTVSSAAIFLYTLRVKALNMESRMIVNHTILS